MASISDEFLNETGHVIIDFYKELRILLYQISILQSNTEKNE